MDKLKEEMDFLKRGTKFCRAKSFVWIPARAWKLGAEGGKLVCSRGKETFPLDTWSNHSPEYRGGNETPTEEKGAGLRGNICSSLFLMMAPRSGNGNSLCWVMSCFNSQDLCSYPSPSDICWKHWEFKFVERSSKRLNFKVKQHIHLVTAL